MLTPAMVHTGNADNVLDARHAVLSGAYAAHPGRFIAGAPKRARLSAAIWINQPADHSVAA